MQQPPERSVEVLAHPGIDQRVDNRVQVEEQVKEDSQELWDTGSRVIKKGTGAISE